MSSTPDSRATNARFFTLCEMSLSVIFLVLNFVMVIVYLAKWASDGMRFAWISLLIYGMCFCVLAVVTYLKVRDGLRGYSNQGFVQMDVLRNATSELGDGSSEHDHDGFDVENYGADFEDGEPKIEPESKRDTRKGSNGGDDNSKQLSHAEMRRMHDSLHDESHTQLQASLKLRTSTKVLIVACIVLWLMSILTAPAPNSLYTILTLFYGGVLLLLTYMWVTEVVFEEEARTPWLGMFLIMEFFLLLFLTPRINPAFCVFNAVGAPGRSFAAKIEDIPWNCISPKFEIPDDGADSWSKNVVVSKRAGIYWVEGVLPELPSSPAGNTIKLHCAGHQDWLESEFYFASTDGPISTDKNDRLVVSEDWGPPANLTCDDVPCCPDYPDWTHVPADSTQLELQLFLAAVFLLGSSWVGKKVLHWCRQRGWCLCLWCVWCRSNYHGLNQAPESALTM